MYIQIPVDVKNIIREELFQMKFETSRRMIKYQNEAKL